MAGHSKWANIKHRKEKADKAKGKMFSRIAKEIISAVRLDGPDPKTNTRLRLAIAKAKTVNMPNDNIDRNIAKASSKEQSNYDEITYELYGYGGVGILVEGMTDNRNRFSSDIRIATNKRGGVVANPGAVTFNFDRKGIIQIEKKDLKEDDVFAAAIDSGAEDFDQEDELYMVITAPDELYQVKEKLEAKSFTIVDSNIVMIPKLWIACSKEDQEANLALIAWLEDTDDVDVVYHNMEVQ